VKINEKKNKRPRVCSPLQGCQIFLGTT
jgi:hypothetical protein